MRWITLLATIILLASTRLWCQSLPPIGGWRDHLPYHHPIALATTDESIIAATRQAAFYFTPTENLIERKSKVNGLSESSITSIAYNKSSKSLIIGYASGGIDIIDPSGVKYIDALKRSALSTAKSINHITFNGDKAYLSTPFGIILLDQIKKEISGTYIIGKTGEHVYVNSTTIHQGHVYAGTAEGLKRIVVTSTNPQDFRNWEAVRINGTEPDQPISNLLSVEDKLFAVKNDSIFLFTGNSWNLFYASAATIKHLSSGEEGLLVTAISINKAQVVQLTPDGTIKLVLEDSTQLRAPYASVQFGSDFFVADSVRGLLKVHGTNYERIVPASPYNVAHGESFSSFDMVGFTSSGIPDRQPTKSINGYYIFRDDQWTSYNRTNQRLLEVATDVNTITFDPADQKVWTGSFGGGLINETDNDIQVITSPMLNEALDDPGSFRVSGLAIDRDRNLWLLNSNTTENLVVKKPDNSFERYSIPFFPSGTTTGRIVIDDEGNKWITGSKENGLIAFSDGATLSNPGDDKWTWYRSGSENGNLPANEVLSIRKDKEGSIWVGTSKGIGIIQCPQLAFSQQGCKAVIPVVQRGNFYGNLFGDQRVQAIEVNGENQKWIGTTNGVFLVSAEGEKLIHHFTIDNSPLPSNDIRAIAILGRTGEVFISTTEGIVSYRGGATEVSNTRGKLQVFPNPVPPGYSGSIAIRGLPSNSLVQITELSGRMVYQSRALGGQISWHGRDATGRRIVTGVYLVLVSDEAGKSQQSTKIFYISK